MYLQYHTAWAVQCRACSVQRSVRCGVVRCSGCDRHVRTCAAPTYLPVSTGPIHGSVHVQDLPPYERALWGEGDAMACLRNLFNVPVLAYSGENDRQIQAGIQPPRHTHHTHAVSPSSRQPSLPCPCPCSLVCVLSQCTRCLSYAVRPPLPLSYHTGIEAHGISLRRARAGAPTPHRAGNGTCVSRGEGGQPLQCCLAT
jgi:hypothetical protein